MRTSRWALAVLWLAAGGCDSKNDESLQPEYTEPSEALEDPNGRQEAINIAERKARAVLRAAGDDELEAVARFVELDEGVKVVVEITHADAGRVTLRAHDSEDCAAVREHPAANLFDPEGASLPKGSLGDVRIGEEGEGRFDRVVPDVTLHPELDASLLGKVAALHAAPETGQAARSEVIACGTIDAEP